MPKYRFLTEKELDDLSEIFVNFLAANSITSDDWQKIKQNDSKRLEELLENFSDVVFEKSLSNIKYLEKREPQRLYAYKVNKDSIDLLGIEIKGESPIDFTLEFELSALKKIMINSDVDYSIIKGSKRCGDDIKKDIFDLLELGVFISKDNVLYDIIKTLSGE